MKTKVCRKCKERKTEKLFTKNSKTVDGLGSYCKDCFNAYARENKRIKAYDQDRKDLLHYSNYFSHGCGVKY